MVVTSKLTALSLLAFQATMIIFYSVFVDYGSLSTASATFVIDSSNVKDMALIVLVGFGVIMTYLRSHRWSSVGFTLLVTALTIEYYILWGFLWESVAARNFTRYVTFGENMIVKGLYSATAVLVSYGAFLGRVGPFELFVTVLLQIIGYSCN